MNLVGIFNWKNSFYNQFSMSYWVRFLVLCNSAAMFVRWSYFCSVGIKDSNAVMAI